MLSRHQLGLFRQMLAVQEYRLSLGEAEDADCLPSALRSIQQAIQRLDDGWYGWCQSCGAPLGYLQLAADPAAECCEDCARLPHEGRGVPARVHAAHGTGSRP